MISFLNNMFINQEKEKKLWVLNRNVDWVASNLGSVLVLFCLATSDLSNLTSQKIFHNKTGDSKMYDSQSLQLLDRSNVEMHKLVLKSLT